MADSLASDLSCNSKIQSRVATNPAREGRNNLGRTALLRAAHSDDQPAVQWLLANGSNLGEREIASA